MKKITIIILMIIASLSFAITTVNGQANIIIDPDFPGGTANWYLQVADGDGYGANFNTPGDGWGEIEITAYPAENQFIEGLELRQEFTQAQRDQLTVGSSHTLTFKAKAEAGQTKEDVKVYFGQAVFPFDTFLADTITFGATETAFSFDFNVPVIHADMMVAFAGGIGDIDFSIGDVFLVLGEGAHAGPNQTLSDYYISETTLDGSASYFNDGIDATKTQWTLKSGPEGVTVNFSDANSLQPEVSEMTESGTYVFELTVVSNGDVTSTDEVNVTVPQRPEGICSGGDGSGDDFTWYAQDLNSAVEITFVPDAGDVDMVELVVTAPAGAAGTYPGNNNDDILVDGISPGETVEFYYEWTKGGTTYDNSTHPFTFVKGDCGYISDDNFIRDGTFQNGMDEWSSWVEGGDANFNADSPFMEVQVVNAWQYANGLQDVQLIQDFTQPQREMFIPGEWYQVDFDIKTDELKTVRVFFGGFDGTDWTTIFLRDIEVDGEESVSYIFQAPEGFDGYDDIKISFEGGNDNDTDGNHGVNYSIGNVVLAQTSPLASPCSGDASSFHFSYTIEEDAESGEFFVTIIGNNDLEGLNSLQYSTDSDVLGTGNWTTINDHVMETFTIDDANIAEGDTVWFSVNYDDGSGPGGADPADSDVLYFIAGDCLVFRGNLSVCSRVNDDGYFQWTSDNFTVTFESSSLYRVTEIHYRTDEGDPWISTNHVDYTYFEIDGEGMTEGDEVTFYFIYEAYEVVGRDGPNDVYGWGEQDPSQDFTFEVDNCCALALCSGGDGDGVGGVNDHITYSWSVDGVDGVSVTFVPEDPEVEVSSMFWSTVDDPWSEPDFNDWTSAGAHDDGTFTIPEEELGLNDEVKIFFQYTNDGMSTSTFAKNDSFTISTCTTLPIELLDFTAKCSENQIDIKWSTATEINNDYFLLERSSDFEHWEFVTQKYGAGTTSMPTYYNVTDYNINHSDDIYYKLTQFDFDGQSEAFGPIDVRCDQINADLEIHSIQVYDNYIDVYYSSSVSNLDVEIVDVYGNILLSKKINNISTQSANKFTSSLQLSNGIYIISMSNEYKHETRRFIF